MVIHLSCTFMSERRLRVPLREDAPSLSPSLRPRPREVDSEEEYKRHLERMEDEGNPPPTQWKMKPDKESHNRDTHTQNTHPRTQERDRDMKVELGLQRRGIQRVEPSQDMDKTKGTKVDHVTDEMERVNIKPPRDT